MLNSMLNSSNRRKWSPQENTTPVSKIKSLIKNLDAELIMLYKQYAPRTSENSLRTASQPVRAINRNHNRINVHRHVQDNKNNKNTKNQETFHGDAGPSKYLQIISNNPNGVQVQNVRRWAIVPSNMSPTPQSKEPTDIRNVYRAKIVDAYRNRRIFTVHGHYAYVRRALVRRGWLEKLSPARFPRLQHLSEEELLKHARRGNDYEAVLLSKMMRNYPAFFIWQQRRLPDARDDSHVWPLRNRVRRCRQLDFSTKVGLIGCANQQQWVRQDGVCHMSNPRFYCLQGEDRDSFVTDYRLTQCHSLLRFIVEHRNELEKIVDMETGAVPLYIVSFALSRVRQQIAEWDNPGFVDDEIQTLTVNNSDANAVIEDWDWQTFIKESDLIIQNKSKFVGNTEDLAHFLPLSLSSLDTLEREHPDYKWDGCRNLWILKPGYQSRGIGIYICHALGEIIKITNSNTNRRYIAQKYIERPLLIYKTKFDIRQYMLLSIGESIVSIWLYKDCYLRFSSQEYSINDVRQSIHLTNNSVQKKYKNKRNRDSRLPIHNMWSLQQFKTYLRQQQQIQQIQKLQQELLLPQQPQQTQQQENKELPDIWNTKIYPGFRENLIAVVLASLEETELVHNTFELYGCDFMLDEQYNPILIEINSTPDLSASTMVTANICPRAIDDLIRVIVDLPRNSRASTGKFELVYSVDYKTFPIFKPQYTELNVSGKAIPLCPPSSVTLSYNSKPQPQPAKPAIKKSGRTYKIQTRNMLKRSASAYQKALSANSRCNGSNLRSFDKHALALQYTRQK